MPPAMPLCHDPILIPPHTALCNTVRMAPCYVYAAFICRWPVSSSGATMQFPVFERAGPEGARTDDVVRIGGVL